MAQVPGVKKIVKFSQELRGGFGRFKTDQSFQLHYLMTSVPIQDVSQLSTASELFRLETIDFEELIQRDIDHKRVQKIANDYLSQGQGKVIFFPPLLACVVLLENDGSIKKKYDGIIRESVDDDGVPAYRTTWDGDGFQLDLPIGDADSCTRQISNGGTPQYFHEFAATLKLNPKRAKLVVLDGQHRLEAMRLLRRNPEQKGILEGIEIPICLVWAPEASAASSNDEDMVRDFRELFVRVNSEPQKVSGHFITLLKDDSYSAMATRQLASMWKSLTVPNGWTRLHLLEWNTRENERVDTRTREFSITTISTISKTLEDHLFGVEAAPDLLNLEDRKQDFLSIASDFSMSGISDRTQSTGVNNIVKEQINKILIPALDVLFRTATPYQKLEKSVDKAFLFLQQKVDENNSSFIQLKANFSRYIYKSDEMFEESAKAAYVDFKNTVVIDQAEKVFFYYAFQQALIRYWIGIATILKPFSIDAHQAAKTAIAGAEEFCFKNEVQFLIGERKYTRRMLWKNANVNFDSKWAKKAWLDLLCASLLNKNVCAAMVKHLEKDAKLDKQSLSAIGEHLKKLGEKSACEYLSKLKDEFLKETKQSLGEFFSEERANQLRSMKESGHEADRGKFEAAIREKTDSRVREAMEELADQLLISTEELQRIVDAA